MQRLGMKIHYLLLFSISFALCVATFSLFSAGRNKAHATNVTFHDISPNRSNLGNATAGSGGRINHLAAAPGFSTFYAASEWGGLFKSTDDGETWEHLDGHLPTATWDVKVDPVNPQIVYATSFYDGRVKSRAGINVSRDGGVTWDHPHSANPPAELCSNNPDEPSAFGIAIDPIQPEHVYVGTNCGLALSDNRGQSWRYIHPAFGPKGRNEDVWSVIVHHNVIDVCGSNGHSRSRDGGLNWIPDSQQLQLGKCSLAASPDDPDVIFIASDGIPKKALWESDDGGQTWPSPLPFDGNSRPAFVRTNKGSEGTFDLWYGAVQLSHKICSSSPLHGQSDGIKCTTADGWKTFSAINGAHDDAGDILFGPDNCPALYSSDGGVYLAKRTPDKDCQDPLWREPSIKTPHALWLLSLAGIDHKTSENSYSCELRFGCRDNGAFSTNNAGDAAGWKTFLANDVADLTIDPDNENIMASKCCDVEVAGGNPPITLLISAGREARFTDLTYPGQLVGGGEIDSIENFGKNKYVITTKKGVFKTENVWDHGPPWSLIGNNGPTDGCGVRVAISNSEPTFFVQAGVPGNACLGHTPDKLFRYGPDTQYQWQPIYPPQSTGGFGIFAVSPRNPKLIIASHIIKEADQIVSVSMVLSADGGVSWSPLPQLDELMTGHGTFKYYNHHGPTNNIQFAGYVQPTLVAFDRINPDLIIAGGADSGIFYSSDGGRNWKVLTNNSGDPENPQIPRPGLAFIDHLPDHIDLYIGTKGRGVWRIRLTDQ